MTAPKFVKHKVAIVGTRYSEFSIEEEILRPLGVEIVFSTGKDSETIIAEAGDAEIILAGAPPKIQFGNTGSYRLPRHHSLRSRNRIRRFNCGEGTRHLGFTSC